MKISRLIKRSAPLYGALLALRQLVFRAYMNALNKKRGLSPNTVAFSSFKGAAFSDSPRAIAEALHALRPETDIVFQLDKNADAPAWVRRARPRSLKWLSECARAKVLVDNFNRPKFMLKYPGQKYVQTWHGDRGFKKVLYDLNQNDYFPDGELMDLAVAGSDFCESMYRTAFRYKGEVMKLGLPRNDALVGAPGENDIKTRLGIPRDCRVLLYAPTFRDSKKGAEFVPEFDLKKAVEKLREATGDKWVCACRGHDQNTGVSGADIDLTKYPEMADVMRASDILITDYSSCAGDFPLLGRPVILYISGEKYERGLYFDLEKSPFAVARSEEELYRLFENPPDNSREILDFFGANETGRSARAVARRIIEWLDEPVRSVN